MTDRISCSAFAEEALHIELTMPQDVLIRVSVDGEPISGMTGERRDVAEELFGGAPEFNRRQMSRLLWLLGRGSGKTTLGTVVSLYQSFTCPIVEKLLTGIPTFYLVAPEKSQAIGTNLHAVQSILGNSKLSSAQEKSRDDDTIKVRRRDGFPVDIIARGPAKGGLNVRSRPIIGYVMDEAQHFNSDPNGRFLVNDRDMANAMSPRMMAGSTGVFISTPWPSENMMGKLVKEEHGNPKTSVCAIGSSILMRPDLGEEYAERLTRETEADPQTAQREFFCLMQDTGFASSIFTQVVANGCIRL